MESSPVENVSGAFVAMVTIILRSDAALLHSGVSALPLPLCNVEALGVSTVGNDQHDALLRLAAQREQILSQDRNVLLDFAHVLGQSRL